MDNETMQAQQQQQQQQQQKRMEPGPTPGSEPLPQAHLAGR